MSDTNDTLVLELSKGYKATVDADCPEWVKNKKWCVTRTNDCTKFYAIASIKENGKRKTLLLHRALLNAQKGQIVDHINGDSLDNRLCNLRFCNVSQNGANSKPKKNKRFKGIYFRKDRNSWIARVVFNYKKIYVGEYKSEEMAAAAYDVAAKIVFKEFCKTNFNKPTEWYGSLNTKIPDLLSKNKVF
jgi:hypothetical protein